MSSEYFAVSEYGIGITEENIEKMAEASAMAEEDVVNYLVEELNVIFCNDVNGNFMVMKETGKIDWANQVPADKFSYLLPLKNEPNPFIAAYGSMDEAIAELKERLSEKIPGEGMSFENNIGYLCGVEYC